MMTVMMQVWLSFDRIKKSVLMAAIVPIALGVLSITVRQIS